MEESTIKKDGGKKRPVVVSILAVILFFNGILTIVSGFRFEAGPIVLALGIIALLLSIGLWMLWSWAWAGTVLLQIIAIGFAVYDWFTGGPIDVLGMGLAVVIIIYLLRSEIRAVFFS